ncbi:MAG: RNA-binding S4 domain-containing protein [Rhodospirillales bacterium]|nr:RNA-binding S4 domain-containing protein [Rhodospirillales bacterium]
MDGESQRVDKWLWHARFFKSRSLATRFCASGKLRVNAVSIHKAHHAVRSGDVLTFPLGPYIRVIQVLAFVARRGSAGVARTLYQDLDPPRPRDPSAASHEAARRDPGSGRPTKQERRATDRLRSRA